VKYLAFIVLLVTSACAGDLPAEGDPRLDPEVEAIVLEPGASLADPADPAEPGPCDCPDAARLKAWTDEHLGCNVCVSLVCEGGTGMHACNPCP
jgi:hypothetical protein